jgi:hypothetical protein
MRVFLAVAVLLAVVAAAADEDILSESDRRALTELREGFVEEVGGFEAGKGQPHSLLLTFQSGLRAVCKARLCFLSVSVFADASSQNGRASYWKMDQLVNEVFAFYLDRLLRMGHVPPATISVFSGLRFRAVKDSPLLKQQWRSGDPLVCSVFVDDAKPAVWPSVFTRQNSQLSVASGERWSDADKRSAEEWGKVIAFDFLIGNTERLPNSLSSTSGGYQAKAKRKTAAISLSGCRHADCRIENAWRDETGRLVLVDNNSGFFFDKMNSMLDPLSWFLEDTCVFPAAFVTELTRRGTGTDLRSALSVAVNRFEPEGPMQGGVRVMAFRARYQALVEHLMRCKSSYNNRLSFFP